MCPQKDYQSKENWPYVLFLFLTSTCHFLPTFALLPAIIPDNLHSIPHTTFGSRAVLIDCGS